MCKKFIYITLFFTLVLGLAGEQAWGQHRAAYWDVRYPTCFTHGRSLRDAFEFDGYEILDADQLKTWMDARIADGIPSVVVFCQDIAPDTVVESMSSRCTLRRYLDAGGKIVWYADIPMFYQGHSDGTRTDWGNNGSIIILGLNATDGPWDSEDEVTITADGLGWGLTETWRSERPTSRSGLRVLAEDNRGYAAAWVKHYVRRDSYRGFVRLFDRVGEPNFNDVRRVAEYGMAGNLYARLPNPADGAVHVYTWASMSWYAGDFAVSHNVYFGENFDDVNDSDAEVFRGNQTSEYFIVGFPGFPYPDGLVPDTTYYWRIDEVNENEANSPWKGNVWSFSISPNAADAPKHFEITYYDNYNYDTDQWDSWQSAATPQDAWDDKYLADGSSGNTVYTDHAFTSITAFDLRGGLFSKDGHASGGEDWNPLQSIGDNVSGQSAHHVFAALFKGLIYLEEGDNLMVASDDDVYVFLDGDTAWGQEVLSIPFASHFDTDSMTVTAAQAGYHTITVKYIERINDHSGIEITLNGGHLQNAEVVRVVTVPGPACIFFAGQDQAILESDYPPDPVGPGDHDNFHNDTALIANSIPPFIEVYGGGKLSISTAGIWGHSPLSGPDGYDYPQWIPTHDEYAILGGISRVTARRNALLGVFLTDDPPDPGAMPPELTSPTTAPLLQQAFFIGSSLENITVPEGATRLFFGLNDGYEWNKNVGSVEVTCDGDVRSRSEVASYPYPADGATHTNSWITLSWSPGMSAISHDVYFGDDRDNVDTGTSGTFKGNQTETWFNVGSVRSPYLVPGTTYYWRIDEVNADGTTYKGDIWSFSRGS